MDCLRVKLVLRHAVRRKRRYWHLRYMLHVLEHCRRRASWHHVSRYCFRASTRTLVNTIFGFNSERLPVNVTVAVVVFTGWIVANLNATALVVDVYDTLRLQHSSCYRVIDAHADNNSVSDVTGFAICFESNSGFARR